MTGNFCSSIFLFSKRKKNKKKNTKRKARKHLNKKNNKRKDLILLELIWMLNLFKKKKQKNLEWVTRGGGIITIMNLDLLPTVFS